VNQLTPFTYLAIFLIGCVFQAGGFWFVTKANAERMKEFETWMKAFETKLSETREDMAWVKGYFAKGPSGGKKR
jgi:hypothetical protein